MIKLRFGLYVRLREKQNKKREEMSSSRKTNLKLSNSSKKIVFVTKPFNIMFVTMFFSFPTPFFLPLLYTARALSKL
jgi:hypothetical protein